MKHKFKNGDGMSLTNSTAEERREIWKNLKEANYFLCNKAKDLENYIFEDRIIVLINDVWFMPNQESRKWDKLTNPLTAQQFKDLILGVKWNWKDAINAVRADHALKIDGSIDVAKRFVKEAFPEDSYDYDKDEGLYFDIGKQISRYTPKFWTDRNPSNLPVIHLSNIKLPNETEDLLTQFNELNAEVLDKLEGFRKAIEGFKVAEAVEKPISLEVGKWYKNKLKSLSTIFFATEYKDGYFSGYGIETDGDSKWTDETGPYFSTRGLSLATDTEVLQALTAEAIKRGLVVGNGCRISDQIVILKGEYKYTNGMLMLGDVDIFEDGEWSVGYELVKIGE